MNSQNNKRCNESMQELMDISRGVWIFVCKQENVNYGFGKIVRGFNTDVLKDISQRSLEII